MKMSGPERLTLANATSNVPRRRFRILCIGETRRGSDAQAAFMAFERMGHEVTVIDEWNYVPGRWRSLFLRALRKLLFPLFVRELTRQSIDSMRSVRPHPVRASAAS